MSIGAATSFAFGWAIVLGNAIAHAFGGSGVVVQVLDETVRLRRGA
jgi:hypothetical protein